MLNPWNIFTLNISRQVICVLPFVLQPAEFYRTRCYGQDSYRTEQLVLNKYLALPCAHQLKVYLSVCFRSGLDAVDGFDGVWWQVSRVNTDVASNCSAQLSLRFILSENVEK